MPPHVCLLFEVEDLTQASPATVSRTGMIYFNTEDLGWRPFVDSWLDARAAGARAAVATAAGSGEVDAQEAALQQQVAGLLGKLVDQYLEPALEHRRLHCRCARVLHDACAACVAVLCDTLQAAARRLGFSQHGPHCMHARPHPTLCCCRELVPVDRLSAVRTTTRLFDALATRDNGVHLDDGPDALAAVVELWWQYAVIWGLGGSLDADGCKRFSTFMRWAPGVRIAAEVRIALCSCLAASCRTRIHPDDYAASLLPLPPPS